MILVFEDECILAVLKNCQKLSIETVNSFLFALLSFSEQVYVGPFHSIFLVSSSLLLPISDPPMIYPGVLIA